MDVKAVGFDIDGTLYPTFRAYLCSIGHYLVNRHYIKAFSKTRIAMRRNSEDDESCEARLFAENLDCGIQQARSIRDNIIYQGWEKCFVRVKIFSNVRESLFRLKNAGLKLAVLSDFPVGKKLEYFGLTGIFDVELGFPESGHLKPSSYPFHLLASKLEVKPQEVIYIGNNLYYDVIGSENSGMRGVLMGTSRRKVPKDVCFYSNYKQMANSILTEVIK